LHNTIADKECRTYNCKMHGTTKIPKPETLDEMIPHQNLHWSFCTEDNCTAHRSAKDDNGYDPRKQKGKRLGTKGQSKN
jgi:hypothetical protein